MGIIDHTKKLRFEYCLIIMQIIVTFLYFLRTQDYHRICMSKSISNYICSMHKLILR